MCIESCAWHNHQSQVGLMSRGSQGEISSMIFPPKPPYVLRVFPEGIRRIDEPSTYPSSATKDAKESGDGSDMVRLPMNLPGE